MLELRRQPDPSAAPIGERGLLRRWHSLETQPAPLRLAQRVLLGITQLGAEETGYLEKLAALAISSGAQLRLAYCADRSTPHERPLARLQQRARHLGRLLGRPVETVDTEIETLESLRVQLQGCALACIVRPTRAGTWTPRHRDVLSALLRLRSRPVLVVGNGPPQRYASALVPVGLSPGSPQLLRWTDMLAPEAAIELLHVTDIPLLLHRSRPSEPASVLERALRLSRAALEHRLRGLADGFERPQALRCSLLTGALPALIGQRQASQGHDLVVLGMRSRSCWPHVLRPPLALRLARRLDGDLLVVPRVPAQGSLPFFGWEGAWS